MAKRVRGRGVRKGAIGYAGKKRVGSNTFPVAVDRWLRGEEQRLGVSKSAIVTFGLRRLKAGDVIGLDDITQDIARAKSE